MATIPVSTVAKGTPYAPPEQELNPELTATSIYHLNAIPANALTDADHPHHLLLEKVVSSCPPPTFDGGYCVFSEANVAIVLLLQLGLHGKFTYLPAGTSKEAADMSEAISLSPTYGPADDKPIRLGPSGLQFKMGFGLGFLPDGVYQKVIVAAITQTGESHVIPGVRVRVPDSWTLDPNGLVAKILGIVDPTDNAYAEQGYGVMRLLRPCSSMGFPDAGVIDRLLMKRTANPNAPGKAIHVGKV